MKSNILPETDELNEKVKSFVKERLDRLEQSTSDLVDSAHNKELTVTSLEDILALELPESQEEYNFIEGIQKIAQEIKQEIEKYNFLSKSNDEVLDYLKEQCSQKRLDQCANKVFLYRDLDHEIEADELENALRKIALGKGIGIQKKTLDKVFKRIRTKKQFSNSESNSSDTSSGLIEEFNKKYAAMLQMKEFSILLESDNGKLVFQKEADFKKAHQDRVIGVDMKGRPIMAAEIWLASPEKRAFNDIVFNPDPNRDMPEKDYNLWKGFAVEEKEGSVIPFQSFTKEVICNGNEAHFEYVWNWIARMIQKPHKNAETAIVLKGKQGTGKNTFVDIVGALLGEHYSPLSSIEQLLGRFDFHHANAVLLHANEAIWGGDKRMLGKLKTLITEAEVTVEQKHRDPVTLKNCRHLIFSSNEDWPVHIDRDDRRFLVLELSDHHKEDMGYFNKIREWAGNGGYQALLYDLQHRDISNFDFRDIPQSYSALQIKLDSAPSSEVYIFDVLIERRFEVHLSPTQDSISQINWWKEKLLEIPKNIVYQNYLNWCDFQKIQPETNRRLGRAIKKLIPSTDTDKKSGSRESRLNAYELPPISIARKEFEHAYKSNGVIDWELDSSRDTEGKIVSLKNS